MRRNHKSRRRSAKSRRTARRRSQSRAHISTGRRTNQRGGSFSYTIPDAAVVIRRPTSGGEEEEDAVPTVMTKADMDRQTEYD